MEDDRPTRERARQAERLAMQIHDTLAREKLLELAAELTALADAEDAAAAL